MLRKLASRKLWLTVLTALGAVIAAAQGVLEADQAAMIGAGISALYVAIEGARDIMHEWRRPRER